MLDAGMSGVVGDQAEELGAITSLTAAGPKLFCSWGLVLVDAHFLKRTLSTPPAAK